MVFNVDSHAGPSEDRVETTGAPVGEDERRCLRCHWLVPDYVPSALVLYALSDHRAHDCVASGASVPDAIAMSNARGAGQRGAFAAGAEPVGWQDA